MMRGSPTLEVAVDQDDSSCDGTRGMGEAFKLKRGERLMDDLLVTGSRILF